MESLAFEGREIPIEAGDSIASALYRAGVRTFTRSLKYHRRRGLYCLTGDCPNCLVTVDGEPGVRACTADAAGGRRVRRERGWPTTERDALTLADRLHPLLPVGFYSKTFTRPRWAWPLAEGLIRKTTGIGSLPLGREPRLTPTRHVRTDVLVVGAGIAGLAAARAAAERGRSVLVVDEGRLGSTIAPGPVRDRIHALAAEVGELAGVSLRERHTALGIYEGPLVPVLGDEELLRVEPTAIVVATGAVEAHGVFPGNDLPGVWLARGAARMAGVHSVSPGRRAVVVASTEEGLAHAATLQLAGCDVLAVVPDPLADRVPEGVRPLVGGSVVAAEGRGELSAVTIDAGGGRRTVPCDALALSLGWAARDGLLRMADGLPVLTAGEVASPGCAPERAERSGAEAGARAGSGGNGPSADGRSEPGPEEEFPRLGASGVVCLCEEVSVEDLELAWDEGWRSSEILKRYTTATMGPCQGALCGRHLARFAADRGAGPVAAARTTARPPVRPVRLVDLVGGVDEVDERRTALHDRHRSMGAHLERSGSWIRPYRYGDPADEYRAVRQRVSVMDVGTLGKFLVGGPDAAELLDRVFPTRIEDLPPGRVRYTLALDEGGYVIDDGLVGALGDGRFFVTSTSGGADRMEAWLRNWADRWDLRARIVDQTAMLGAINVAGPRARSLLGALSGEALEHASFPLASHRELSIRGIPCRAIRVAFVGELSYELHHPASRSVELWDALLDAGRDLGIRPHGLDALDVLRLERGHVYVAQDTLPDDDPSKLGLGWVVADKPAFVGKVSLERIADLLPERRLVGLGFSGGSPKRGAPLSVGGQVVGRVTSAARSPAVGREIGLGWIRTVDGAFPTALDCGDGRAEVVSTPFYDPRGDRQRG